MAKKAEQKQGTKQEKPQQKPKILMIAFGGCNGCHVSTLDMHEGLLDVVPNIEFVRASVIADMNRDDIPECDIALIEGAICNSENKELVQKVRERAKTLVALGSCACFGGVPGLRNYFDVQSVIEEAYINAASNVNEEGTLPNDSNYIAQLENYVKPVNKVVDVDFMVPGCPPVPDIIKSALLSLAEGKTPELPTKNLCEECGRKHRDIAPGDRQFLTFQINTVMESDLDEESCFLEQGVLCMGPATRSGCGGRCTKANMPCRGCMGPNPEAIEQGSELSNAMAPMLPIGALVKKEDLPGTFYRYALASSILPTVVKNYRDIRKGINGKLKSNGKGHHDTEQ